ncbi:SCO4225 family membrane protein [Streptomyces sp. NPDC001292]|uniref:SCO4225 family membrane protein n=1 Tax=Streptomyces sp. NPDC001292 TaxID=3364558 RepID=UPI0036C3DAFA
MSNASRPRRLRQLLALATGNWLARGYLAVFAVSVLAMFLFPESGVASSPLLLTAPLSLLAMVLPLGPGTGGGGVVEALAIGSWVVWLLLCVFVNAAVLGALLTRSATVAPTGVRESVPRVAAPSEREGKDMARPASRRSQRTRALLAPAVDNWLARGYLAVAAASLGFFLYAAYLLPDPGFAGIWPLMTTAPLSIVALLAASPAEWASSPDWLSPLVFSVGAALSGLFNAVLLGLLARRLRAGDARPAA